MKQSFTTFIFGSITILLLMVIHPFTETGELILKVGSVQKSEGIIWVGIYDSETNFLVKEKAIVEGFKVDKTAYISCNFPELKYGNYGIAVFHDVNANGEMDTNFLGIPTEPYGFSGTVNSKWRLPRFREVQFDFVKSGQLLEIALEEW